MTSIKVVIGHEIYDCEGEFGPHDELGHASCSYMLWGMNPLPTVVEDPTGCSYPETCVTCGRGRKFCDQFDEPAPTLETETTMTAVPTPARDLKPGDQIERLGPDLEFVLLTVARVEKIRPESRTGYQVFLEVGEPFVMSSRARVNVVTA